MTITNHLGANGLNNKLLYYVHNEDKYISKIRSEIKSQMDDKIIIVAKIRHTLLRPNLIYTIVEREGMTPSLCDYRAEILVLGAALVAGRQSQV